MIVALRGWQSLSSMLIAQDGGFTFLQSSNFRFASHCKMLRIYSLTSSEPQRSEHSNSFLSNPEICKNRKVNRSLALSDGCGGLRTCSIWERASRERISLAQICKWFDSWHRSRSTWINQAHSHVAFQIIQNRDWSSFSARTEESMISANLYNWNVFYFVSIIVFRSAFTLPSIFWTISFSGSSGTFDFHSGNVTRCPRFIRMLSGTRRYCKYRSVAQSVVY